MLTENLVIDEPGSLLTPEISGSKTPTKHIIFHCIIVFMRKSIILVDDHALLLNGIKNWIENHSDYKVEFQASNVEECKEIQNQFEKGRIKADDFLAVVDISFKSSDSQMENSGFGIIKEFSLLGIPCIAYSSHDSGGFIEHATSSAVGAKGFVSKTADESILLAAINSVANGGTYIQAELITGLLEVRDITQTFTKKEKLVADTLTIHNTNAEVAAALGIAEKTVVNYLTILYDKAGVENKLKFLEKMGRL